MPTTPLRTLFVLLFYLLLAIPNLSAQEDKKPVRWGIQFGYATQQTKPFHDLDYDFEQGVIIGHILLKKIYHEAFQIDIIAEGGYYFATHQLINKWFTRTVFFNDFPESFHREMLQKKSVHEVVAHLGAEISHFIRPNVQLYGYAAIGPMWVSQQTERLAPGFAFSDNLGMGVKLKLTAKVWLNTMLVIRHESNANLKFPNSGHNTLGVRMGVVFNLTPPHKG